MNSTIGNSEINTVRELIDQMAVTQPDRAFLISPETGRLLTFKGLQEQAQHLYARFRQMGLEPGDKIAFSMDNGLLTAQLFLGAMYGGFVAVPLNVRAGATQVSYTLDHCDAKVVFVGSRYDALIKEAMAHTRRTIEVISVELDGWPEANGAPSSTGGLLPLRAEDAALLMYSSGTTGQPNGAVHTHRSILAHGSNCARSHQLTAADRSLLVLPLYHINAECVTLLPALTSGGSVVIPHGFVVSEFWNWLDDYSCTWSAVVPTIISQLLDWKDPKAEARAAAFQRIRFLRTSSAPLSPALHHEFSDKFELLLIQAMGSSEAGNVFSNPLPPGRNKIGSPGLPWGFDTKIVDRDGAELPAGEPGEVLMRGDAMMQGYYKDPVGTAAALDAEGWLHTGDLAYRDEDGYFFVVGRSKELIIKGGMNIAPTQIDEVLEAHPAILEAAAVGVPDRYVGEDLVAFAVLRDGVNCEERELLSFCESHLGHFKTPTRIHIVKDLPKGPSGKVQRLKLLETVPQYSVSGQGLRQGEAAERADGQAVRGDSVVPSTPIEQIIAEIWSKLLERPVVDVHSNFFSLGGHSLLAIQCLSLLREKLPIVLSLSDFFENATIAQQAALIRDRLRPDALFSADSTVAWEHELLQKNGPSAADRVVPRRDGSLPCPLSANQRRIWFMEQLNPEVPVYNESEAVRLRGELRIDLVEKALNVIVARHEILRTTIEASGDEPVTVVHESWPLRLKQIDLSLLPSTEREAEVERLLIDEPRLPYRLEAEPGIRATMLRLGQTEHVLILMMHHIICDWSSVGVFWRELSVLYSAGHGGQHPDLPALAIQHGDYAVWQQQEFAENGLAEDLAYWYENLHGAPTLLDLPTDKPRPRIISYQGARKRFSLPSILTESLRDCSRRERVSLFTLYAAALNTLLYRYTGQEDILVGIPLADRDRPELQSLIGFLLHTHVLRTRLSGELSFRELLARVQKGVLDLYAHRSPPFDQVVGRVQPQRNLSYSPLFQVMINWRDRDQQLSFIGLEGIEVESLLAESRTSKFDLTLMLTDGGDEISLEIEYSSDLFDEERIERMRGHYQTLLEGIAADPGQRLADLPLLTHPERHQVLYGWNATETPFPAESCVHELFEQQVAKTPEAVAVVYEGLELSYAELNARANRLADRLRALGVGPDVLVALFLERSLDMVVGLLGVLKAGGAYVPLDPTHPRKRLAYMLADAQPLVVLTQERLQSELPPHHPHVVAIDADTPSAQRLKHAPAPGRAHGPRDLAYVIYTSGSTGEPKGVEIEHRAVVNMLASMQRRPGLTAEDTMLAITTLAFDIAGLEIFLPLACGARVVIASSETGRDGVALASLVAQSGVSVLQATPTTLQMLLDAGWAGAPHLTVLCGGEAWSSDLANQLLARCGSLWNMYGPTETTVWSAVARVEAGGPIAIGPPIANTRLYVLDGALQPVPVGVPGELWIGGDGLARGYLNRPQLTSERFVTDPFAAEPGARMYRSGDLVRRLPDGTLEFLGRLDLQVKIRGHRIELGEIDAALERHSGIEHCVVLAREDRPGDKRLVAYFVGEADISTATLRAHLASALPEYMVPAAYMRIEALPLTPNGKLDRKALPAPDALAQRADAASLQHRTPTEEILARIWCELLDLKQVGVRDNFFELGGHSLLAVRLASRIRAALGVEIPISSLFEAPTVEQMAEIVSGQKSMPSFSPLVLLRPGDASSPVLLVHGLGGSVMELVSIAKLFPGNFAIYGIQARGLDGTSTPNSTIESMAADYIRAISDVQPGGRYILVGVSFGGLVALEMAHRLIERGDQIGLLALLETYPSARLWPLRSWVKTRVVRRIKKHSLELRALGRDEIVPHIMTKLGTLLQRFGAPAMGTATSRQGDDFPLPPGLMAVLEVDRAAGKRYRPRYYPGKVHYLKCEINTSVPDDPIPIWGRLVKTLEVESMPGDHADLVSTRSADVANWIFNRIQDAGIHDASKGS